MVSTKSIVLTALLLAAVILFFGWSDVDIRIQQHLYDPVQHRWLIDANEPYLKFFLYDGLKRLLIIIGVAMLIATIVLWKRSAFQPYRKGMVIVLFASVLVPSAVGSLKAVTNMPCPRHVDMFGGNYPHTSVWEKYPEPYCNMPKTRCWPAGHASGGFALMALFFLFKKRSYRYLSLGGAIVVGWVIGSYKMMIGDHFFSHTVITMVLAWLIILLIVRAVEWVWIKGVVDPKTV